MFLLMFNKQHFLQIGEYKMSQSHSVELYLKYTVTCPTFYCMTIFGTSKNIQLCTDLKQLYFFIYPSIF